jgi:hypothetical protein
VLLLAGALLLGGARQAAAASSETWTGAAGDNKWETKGNWDINTVPGKNDSVTINSGTVTINAATANINQLTITGGSLSVIGGAAFNMTQGGGNNITLSGGSFNGGSGTVTTGNDLLISGTASYQASSGTSKLMGNLTMTGGTYAGAGTTTVSKKVDVSGGAVLTVGGSMTVTSTVTIQGTGTLTISSGNTLALAGFTMDGTLNATGGTIKASSGVYPFHVGSTATATPTLNINGLAVQNTDGSGMLINSNPSAVTTFTRFDNLAFSSGTAGTGTRLLGFQATTLYLSSNGCTFDGSTTYAVELIANTGASPRALFGNATCATNDATTGLCAASEKKDDDANNDGIPDTGTGAVVQFIRAAESDPHGVRVGFPTAGFDWNTFSWYSTYATFHGASGGSDVIYVRDEKGNPLYSWTDPNLIAGTSETIVGTPLWITPTSGGTHYLYVAVNGTASNTGGIYRLTDSGTGTSSGKLLLDTTWPTGVNTGYYACSCTITSDAQLDSTNLYWAGTNGSGQKLFGIVQGSGTVINPGSPGSWPVTAPANVTTSAPTLVTVSGTTSLYLGATSTLAQLNLSSLAWTQDNPTGIGTITGRVSYGTSILAATSGTARIYAGDASGTVWAVDPNSFSGTSFLWSYAAGSAVTDNYYDSASDTLQFGTSAGKVVVLTGAGSGTSGVVLNSSYPYTLPNSDSVSTAPLYYSGVLVVGTSKGNLYFLDRNTGLASPNGVSILKEVNFGPTESVSSVGFDSTVGRYMVTTSSASNDGRLYYFDLVTDLTASFQ